VRLSSVYETKDVIRENSIKDVPKMSPRTIFFKLATLVETNFGHKGKSGGVGGGGGEGGEGGSLPRLNERKKRESWVLRSLKENV